MSMTYRGEAYNLFHASENRIHDDATAQCFGFTGGLELTQQVMADYLRDVRETAALYAGQGIAHPGMILRMRNWLLTQNVVLGPWIHIARQVHFHSEARLGETLTASGRITVNIERKGHRIVSIEALVPANATHPIAHVTHEAIWRPRQVAEAG